MKLTLMIEGSAATIAAILADLPDGAMPVVRADESTLPFDDDDTAPADPSAPSVDGDGLPWDERIHSGSKKLTAKGVWARRKRVDDATVAAVEAELRGTAPVMPSMPIAFPTSIPMQPMTAPVANVPMPDVAPMPIPFAEPEPEPVVAPTMPTGPVAVTETGPVTPSMTFPLFMQTISQQMAAKTITEDELKWVAGQIGVSVITDCAAQPEKIDAAILLFRQYGKWVD